MRVVFLGTPDFSVPFLQALVQHQTTLGVELVGVITQPDRRKGRGLKTTPPPVKIAADYLKLPLFQCESVRSNCYAFEFLKETRPDLIITVAFGQILPREFFAHPPLGSLNVHTSLLPQYRGAAPVVHAILNGEKETGVSIMKLDEKMDSGEVVAQVSTVIDQDMTAGELQRDLSRIGIRLLLKTLPLFIMGQAHSLPQDHERATFAPRIRKKDACIDWNQSAAQVHDRIRAFNPSPGAFTGLRKDRLKVWRSQNPHIAVYPISSGQIWIHEDGSILVGCGGRTILELLELQLQNRRRLSARDFANGLNLKTGEQLGDYR